MNFTGSKVIIGSGGTVDANPNILSSTLMTFNPQCAHYGHQDLLACASYFSCHIHTIFIFDMKSSQLVQTLSGHESRVTCVSWKNPVTSFLQNSCYLFSGSESGEIFLWDVTEGLVISSVRLPRQTSIRSVIPILSQHIVLIVSEDGENFVFDSLLASSDPLDVDVLPLRPPRQEEPPVATTSPSSAAANLRDSFMQSKSAKFIKSIGSNPGGSSSSGIYNSSATSNYNSSTGANNQQQGNNIRSGIPTWPLPFRVVSSKLHSTPTFAVVMNDRIRVITNVISSENNHLQSSSPPLTEGRRSGSGGGLSSPRPTARDLIYDSEDGNSTTVDAFFSESNEEVLYFATRYTVGSYDWRMGTVLNEQLIWNNGVDEFRSIFPSSPALHLDTPMNMSEEGKTFSHCLMSSDVTLPFFYSFGTDLRLTAWYVQKPGKFSNVATDIRGFRIASRNVFHVVQSDLDSTLFAVLFDNGSIAQWKFNVHTRQWRLLNQVSSPLTRPVCFSRVGVHSLCCALESGQVVLLDALHNVAQRRFNLVYSSGTKIVLLCNHRFEDLVWVVTCKPVDGRYSHQVSLLDTRSGNVVKVLRKPSMNSEPSLMKEASMDSSLTYLLLLYWNSTFEVWNTEDGRLVHLHSSAGVCHVSWAPSELSLCISGVRGNPQLLSVIFSEGTLSLWSVYQDRVVVSRDAIPLLQPSAVQGAHVSAVSVRERLCVFDNAGNGTTIFNKNSKLAARALKEPMVGSGPVVSLAAPQQCRQILGSFISSSFCDPVNALETPNVMMSHGNNIVGDVQLSKNPNFSADNFSEGSAAAGPAVLTKTSFVAAVFQDGSLAVWDLDTGDKLASLKGNEPGGIFMSVRAISVTWIGNVLAVLTSAGNFLILDRHLSSVNSNIASKSLRRPLLNSVFLLPSQRTFIQTSLELSTFEVAENTRRLEAADAIVSRAASNIETITTTSTASNGVSKFIECVPSEQKPCRGPFGQVITNEIQSSVDEQTLYLQTMVPLPLLKHLRELHKGRENIALVAFCVAKYFGYREKQSLWAEVCKSRNRIICETGRKVIKGEVSPEAIVIQKESNDNVCCSLPNCTGMDEVCYFLADSLSAGCNATETVRRNRLALSEQRNSALQTNNNLNVDDSAQRLLLARDYLRLQEHSKAVDVLLNSNYESPQFNLLSTLAVTIASSGAATRKENIDSTSDLYIQTAKQAAAMLLAKGDLHGAVEKYILAGDISEAALALQSQQKWEEAAHLLNCFPRTSEVIRAESNQRWAMNYVKKGRTICAARALLTLGGSYTDEILKVFSGGPHFTDIAGIFALLFLEVQSSLSDAQENGEPNEEGESDPKAREQGEVSLQLGAGQPSEKESRRRLIKDALMNYLSVLKSVGNERGESFILSRLEGLNPKISNSVSGVSSTP